jgi:hypothetical protein
VVAEIRAARLALDLPEVDYEGTMAAKLRISRKVFDAVGAATLEVRDPRRVPPPPPPPLPPRFRRGACCPCACWHDDGAACDAPLIYSLHARILDDDVSALPPFFSLCHLSFRCATFLFVVPPPPPAQLQPLAPTHPPTHPPTHLAPAAEP